MPWFWWFWLMERIPKMTDNYGNDHNVPAVQSEVLPVETNWTDPMLKDVFGGMARAVVERSGLPDKVRSLEAQAHEFKTLHVNVMAERDSLKVENRNLQDQVTSIKDDLQYKEDVLNRTRQNLAEVMRERDQLKDKVEVQERALATANDDRDMAVMELEEEKKKFDKLATDFDRLTADNHQAQHDWSNTTADYKLTISDLTYERDRFRDKFDRAKSFAAQTMRLDQE